MPADQLTLDITLPPITPPSDNDRIWTPHRRTGTTAHRVTSPPGPRHTPITLACHRPARLGHVLLAAFADDLAPRWCPTCFTATEEDHRP